MKQEIFEILKGLSECRMSIGDATDVIYIQLQYNIKSIQDKANGLDESVKDLSNINKELIQNLTNKEYYITDIEKQLKSFTATRDYQNYLTIELKEMLRSERVEFTKTLAESKLKEERLVIGLLDMRDKFEAVTKSRSDVDMTYYIDLITNMLADKK